MHGGLISGKLEGVVVVDDYRQEWIEVQKDAVRLLCDESILPGWHSVTGFTISPSFESNEDFRVYRKNQSNEDAELIGVHSTWQKTIDATVFSSPIERVKAPRPFIPGIDRTFHVISPGVWNTWLKKVHSLVVPLNPSGGCWGIDGTSYTIFVADHRCSINIEWWESLPRQLEAVGQVCSDLRNIVDDSPMTDCPGK